MHSSPLAADAATKVALVTGAGRRIGHDISLALHQAGYNLLLHCHRSVEATRALADTLNRDRAGCARLLQADLTDHDAPQQLATQAQRGYGRLDLLVNNASSFYATPALTASDEQWHDLLGTNLQAPYFLTTALYPTLAATEGCVVNLLDIYSEKPMPGYSIYSIAKAGNRMMVMALAQEFAPRVRVNGIAPGAILWPENAGGEPLQNTEKLAKIPQKRLGGTAPICAAVLYLAEQASYTTGQILTIDGGKSLNL